MNRERQQREIEHNYDAFQRMLRLHLQDHRDQFALMRERRVVGFFETPDDADLEGAKRFPDRIYSIQQVTDEPVQLGVYANGYG